MPKVIVTMPAYRAESTVAATLADLPAKVADEIILVDDASPDDTVKRARELGLRVFVHPENRGYGGNQKTCYSEALRAGGDIIVMLHPDYQYDPKAVPLLIAPILAGNADVTFGSRFAGLGDPLAGGMPFYRFIGNRITTQFENALLGSRFTDMHSGMRAYTRQALLGLPFRSYSDDFLFDSQLLIDAVTLGQRVVEVPIPTRYSHESSSISIPRSLRYIGSSLTECGKAVGSRGRRGRRSPTTFRDRKRGPERPGVGRSLTHSCALCGAQEQALIYPATASGPITPSEFACTTDALSEHDDIIQCRRCGLISALAAAQPTEIIQGYEAVVDETYLNEEHARREVFDWMLRAMDGYYSAGKRLLEIGAHVGMFLSTAGRHGWEAKGIEPSAWAVEQGRERFKVDLVQGTIEALREPERSADVIVMLDVLEHLNDPLEGLKSLRHTLDDDGFLALSTVNVEGLHARATKGTWPWFIRSHLFYFSPQTLDAMLRTAGFRMVEWRTVPRSFHLSYLLHRTGHRLGRSARGAEALSRLWDPRIPTGWLGDIALVIARPDR